MYAGEALVILPLDQPHAEYLLRLADENGIDQGLIRTTEDAYMVPEAMVPLIFPAVSDPEPGPKVKSKAVTFKEPPPAQKSTRTTAPEE